ncbi:MAG: autotransporter-associated beta strand repeat-containing protein [Proteobacteria bacterium]|nr:autotransporter-associated beta strand repeat-containing protein [Pseudomonadota bacterium]
MQTGGSLTIGAGALAGGAVAGGAASTGAASGSAYGAGIYFQGGGGATFDPAAGQTLTLSDAIADQQGSGGTGAQHVTMSGAGTVVLSATNTYSGGTVINGGTVALQAPGAAGTGLIDFGYGSIATLVVGPGDVPTNTIAFFLPGDVIDLQGIGTATKALLGPNDVLYVTGGTVPVQLSLYRGQIFTGETFATASDNHGGTLITPVTINNDHPPFISGTAASGDDHTPFAALAGVHIADLDAGQTETATLQLSTTANGTLSHFGPGSYNAATGTYTVSGSAAQVTAAIEGLAFTPTIHQVAPGASVQTTFDLSVTDGLMQADSPFNVSVTALNDAPTITGGGSEYYGYWGVPLTPFAGMTLNDPDLGASDTVTITLGSYFAGDSGTLSLPNPVDGVTLTTVTPGALYTLSAGSPQAVTAALDALQYTPTTGNPTLGFTIGNIGLSLSDGIAPPVAGPSVVVYAGLPIATGTVANQAVVDTATIQPFPTVRISDSQPFTTVQVTVILYDPNYNPTDANGTLTGAGLTKIGVGTYSLPTASFADASAAVDALVFHPTPYQVLAGQSVTTIFDLEMFDGATTHNDSSTTVIATAPTAGAAAISTGLQADEGIAFLNGFSRANWAGGDADPMTHPAFAAAADLGPSHGGAGSAGDASGANGYGLQSDPMGALAWLLQTATHGEGDAAAM